MALSIEILVQNFEKWADFWTPIFGIDFSYLNNGLPGEKGRLERISLGSYTLARSYGRLPNSVVFVEKVLNRELSESFCFGMK